MRKEFRPSPCRAALPLLGLLLLLAGGCGRGTPRDVDPNDTTDYRAMLERSRARTEARAQLETVQAKIVEFQVRYSRLPASLDELVHFRVLAEIPPPPPGMAYYYDARLGSVRFGPEREANLEQLGEGIGTPSLSP